MRIVSFNANGIRAAIKKGFFNWVHENSPDIICVQETKIKTSELDSLAAISIPGYYVCFADAQKRGYSGVAIYAKQPPDSIDTSLDMHISDSEGRFLQFNYPNFSVVSVYLPSGTTGDERQKIKFLFLDHFYQFLERLVKQDKPIVICGDLNIAHKEIDLKNWKNNQKNSGFLPEERDWLDKVFNNLGLVDAFRKVNSSNHQYTWWSSRGQARQNNVGWRIDYQVVTRQLQDKIAYAEIITQPIFSDHAPLSIEYRGLNYV